MGFLCFLVGIYGFEKPGQPHVEQAEEDESGNGHLLKDNVKNGKAEAKNLPVGRV